MSNKEFLFELLNAPSPTGFEHRGQSVWLRGAGVHADEIDSDAYGNAWLTLRGKAAGLGPQIMLAAHADEIGMTVRFISEKGFLHLGPIGGSDVSIAKARRIRILGDNGDVAAVIGNTAVHLRKKSDDKAPEWHELYCDAGFSSREDAASHGVRVGQAAVFDDAPMEFGEDLLCARALDNRIGGWILAGVLETLKAGERPEAGVTVLNAVQEEIGGNGARMASYRLKPDIALVLDVTHATDVPGIESARHGEVKLGGGPVLTHGTCNHPALVRRLMDCADALKIPVQHEASNARGTSTDADDIFWSREGIPSVLVSVPLRSMHSPAEVVSLADAGRTRDLIAALVRSFHAGERIGRPA